MGEEIAGHAVLRCSAGSRDRYPDFDAKWGEQRAITELWSDSVLREAVLLASPVLAHQVERTLAAAPAELSGKKVKRIHKGLLKYALRLNSRATPFGTFAGLTVLPIGRTEPVLDTDGSRHARGSSTLGRRMAGRVRTDENTLLYTNPAVLERGERYVVLVLRAERATNHVQSLRSTAPVRLVVEFAETPRPRTEIESLLAQRFPEATAETIAGLVSQLVDTEVLLSTADRSFFDADVLDRLPADINGLSEMKQALHAYSTARRPEAEAALRRVIALCEATEIQRDIRVDLELTASGEIPVAARTAAQAALRVLTRIGPVQSENALLTDFCRKFRERYGHTLVPVTTVVDEELGIGYPSAYTTPGPAENRKAELGDRHRRLVGKLLERARLGALDTVEITDADLAEFPEPGNPVSSYDVFVRLPHPGSGCLPVVTGTNFPGGASVGRFTTTIPGALTHARRCVQWDIDAFTRSDPGGVLCDIDYVGGTDTLNEVSGTAPLYPATLTLNSVGDLDGTQRVRLQDIYLAPVGDRVRTFLRDGTPLRFRKLNMATPIGAALIVRLLRDLSSDGVARPRWDWGEAGSILHALPAVRYRDVIVAEQRWRYPVAGKQNRAAVQQWLRETGVCRYVFAGAADNRLLLDTEHPLHLDLLVDQLSSGLDIVYAAPTPDEHAAVRDTHGRRHCAEAVITIPVPDGESARNPMRYSVYDDGADAQRLLAPGGEWTYATIKANPLFFDSILTEFHQRFPDLLGHWYFVRYHHEGAGQLRLRIHRRIGELGRFLEWLADARLAGRIGDYSFPVHHREIERYGGAQSFPAYEEFFCAESAAIVAMLPILSDDRGRAAPPREGIELAAGVVAAWLTATAPHRTDLTDVVRRSTDSLAGELGEGVHEIKANLRGRKLSDCPEIVTEAFCGFWNSATAEAARRDPAVLQSACHLLCNRLGLSRAEEFAALWMIRTKYSSEDHRDATR